MTSRFTVKIRGVEVGVDSVDDLIDLVDKYGADRPETRTPKANHRKRRAVKTDKTKTRIGRPPKEKSSTRDLVLSCIKGGPKRVGAIVKALKGQAVDTAVYAMVSYLSAKGEIKKNKEDATYSIA